VLIAEHMSQPFIDNKWQEPTCRAPHPSGNRSAADRPTISAECVAVDNLIVDRMTQ